MRLATGGSQLTRWPHATSEALKSISANFPRMQKKLGGAPSKTAACTASWIKIIPRFQELQNFLFHSKFALQRVRTLV